jgi:hypothetical protein
MYIKISGLPAHPLVVHATAVVVPLAALTVAAVALWPWLRRRLGLLPLGLATIALALVPLTTSTGEQLAARLPESQLIDRHAELADGLLPWAFGLFVAAVFGAWLDRRRGHGQHSTGQHSTGRVPAPRRAPARTVVDPAGRPIQQAATSPSPATGGAARPPSATAGTGAMPVALRVTAVALALVAAGGTVVQVVRIGDTGAKAAWSDVPATPRPDAGKG